MKKITENRTNYKEGDTPMGSFKGSEKLVLLEGDDNVPFIWELDVSDTISDNKFVPFGADATAVTTTTYSEDGTAVTSIVQSTTLTSNVITCLCDYPTEGPGTYTIKFQVEMDNAAGTIRNAHDRIYAELNS